MAQVNHVFGKTLEFSTTVSNGKITSQELVSSNEDSIISFKLDKNFLCPKVLRDLASKIDAEKGVPELKLASDVESSAYVKNAKESGAIQSGMFSACQSGAVLAIAEYLANQDGLTLYGFRATTEVPEPTNNSAFVNQDGEPSEDPDDDEEDEDDYDEDEWDDNEYDSSDWDDGEDDEDYDDDEDEDE